MRPEITDAHRQLHRFAGLWQSEEMMMESPWAHSGPAHGVVKTQVILGGFFVMADYEQTRNGAVSYTNHSLMTFDSAEAKVKLFGFDSFGFVPSGPAQGTWQGDVLTLIRVTPRGQARQEYHLENDTTYRLTLSNSLDDGRSWIDVMRGTYRRAG